MLESGSKAYLETIEKPSKDVGPVELVRRELLRKADAQAAQLRRGLSVLASVGSTAPFVGLLGTVIGIIGAFQGIAAEGSGGLGAVSAGIAEALVVTAFGLLVAIPAVLIYNFLTTKSDALLLSLDQFRGEYLDHLEARHTEYVEAIGAADAGGRPQTDGEDPQRELMRSAA
jgi:biopolymer transport protein ExbB